MKFSEKWLREWVSPALSTRELADQLTMSGLEVESIERAGPELPGVVVAEVLAVEPHPDAERLRVCRVSDGSTEHRIVCGAPNVRVGMRVALAREGARLPGLEIKRSTIRGVESNGMLCGADELGIEHPGDGLLELPADMALGQDIGAALQLDDALIELGLTPNRGDCLGIRGLAREVALLNNLPFTDLPLRAAPVSVDDSLPVTLSAPEACPHYVGRVIRNIDASVGSPLWLQERLRRCGVRSIDAVVDVTNYVLLELGQPMHAFDLQKLQGGIDVRLSTAGETIALLDGSVQTLQAGTLLIADGSGPVAMAGVMGGKDSAVGPATRDLFLESAFFSPGAMAGKARAYGMHTDASQRFERGVDFRLQTVAIERATELLLAIVGGQAGPLTVASAPAQLPAPAVIRLREARLRAVLGVDVPHADVARMLTQVGCGVESDADGWRVTPPSFRFDIRIEADLIEEVARVHGYDRIPSRVQPAAIQLRPDPETRRPLTDLRRHLVALGYQEAITYSFVEPRTQQLLEPQLEPVPVTNPISADMAVMRTTLWAGLIKAVQFNQNRQQRRARLFETGLRFITGADGLQQRLALAGIACGDRTAENWAAGAADIDFFDIKGDVQSLLAAADMDDDCRFEPATHPALHPGQCARLRRGKETLGHVGALHPELLDAFDLRGPVYLFELDYEKISSKNLPRFKGLSKFPEVRRDIAVVLDEAVPASSVLETVRTAAGENLVDLRLIDIYRGQGIDPAKKSMTIGFVLQNVERTLTDSEANATQDRILAALADACGAVLRY